MLDSSESSSAARSLPMGKKGRPTTKPKRIEEIPGQAERLKRLREAYGYPTTAAFARFLDLPNTTYNAFENGFALSRPAVFRIVQKIPGVTSDYLYFGRFDGMPLEVSRRLGFFDPPSGKRSS